LTVSIAIGLGFSTWVLSAATVRFGLLPDPRYLLLVIPVIALWSAIAIVWTVKRAAKQLEAFTIEIGDEQLSSRPLPTGHPVVRREDVTRI